MCAEQHRARSGWLDQLLASPVRRLWHDPRAILSPWVWAGMTVLELRPATGFFTLELARLVGPGGRVVAADTQPQVLELLLRRSRSAGLGHRIEVREARRESRGLEGLESDVDFALAFAVVDETPDLCAFFAQVHRVLRPGGRLLLAEPAHRVSEAGMAELLTLADRAGFWVEALPPIRLIRSAILRRGEPS